MLKFSTLKINTLTHTFIIYEYLCMYDVHCKNATIEICNKKKEKKKHKTENRDFTRLYVLRLHLSLILKVFAFLRSRDFHWGFIFATQMGIFFYSENWKMIFKKMVRTGDTQGKSQYQKTTCAYQWCVRAHRQNDNNEKVNCIYIYVEFAVCVWERENESSSKRFGAVGSFRCRPIHLIPSNMLLTVRIHWCECSRHIQLQRLLSGPKIYKKTDIRLRSKVYIRMHVLYVCMYVTLSLKISGFTRKIATQTVEP